MNEKLNKAKKAKNDEFYTTKEMVEELVQPFLEDFKGKTIYMPFDSEESEFWKYFKNNFEKLGLKLIFRSSLNSKFITMFDGVEDLHLEPINENYNGSYDSEELIPIIKSVDFIISNPPFSIERAIVNYYNEYGKKFILVASNLFVHNNSNFVLNKELFFNQLYNSKFTNTEKKVNCIRIQNIKQEAKKKISDIFKIEYDDNGIRFCKKMQDFDINYTEPQAIPISFFINYDFSGYEVIETIYTPVINGVNKFARVLIKKRGV